MAPTLWPLGLALNPGTAPVLDRLSTSASAFVRTNEALNNISSELSQLSEEVTVTMNLLARIPHPETL